MMFLKNILVAGLMAVAMAGVAVAEQAGHEHGKQADATTHDEKGHDEKGHDEKGHDEKGHDEKGHDEKGHGHGESEPGVVKLTPAQIRMGGIKVDVLRLRSVPAEVRVPGEVRLNAYRTSRITPRIQAQIIARHVVQGQHVSKGQALVTLSSVEMARVQGRLITTEQEWQRVRRLGRSVVSGKRYVRARVERQLARARARAFGMTRAQIDAFIARGSVLAADGRFQLLAPMDGTVISDDFVLGEVVEPGKVLLVVSDESRPWVDVRISPVRARDIRIGAAARVMLGKHSLPGKVVQMSHTLDPETRTRTIRVEADNRQDKLHPGQFVDVAITLSRTGRYLAVPRNALMRGGDGDWQIFIQRADGSFKAVEVQRQRVVGDRVVITGVKPGVRYVTHGAFFLQSEIAKSGFDIHNH